MFKLFFRCLFLLGALLTTMISFAQDKNLPESGMRSNGKIYVVMTICLTILIGLILYVVSIDRKIGKIEDNQ